MRRKPRKLLQSVAVVLAASGSLLATTGLPSPAEAAAPPDFVGGRVVVRHFTAQNDLLTAGLGWEGIRSGAAPPVSNPPTVKELRRLAIYNSMRGLISVFESEGFRTIYGTHGPVPGTEYTAFTKGPDGAAATVLVQIPDDLNTSSPCIVTAPSSGSRGIYGAVSNAEVAFKNGCAVAYTDKGTGVGFHDLTRDHVYGLLGVANPSGIMRLPHFRAEDTAALRNFKTRYPHRIAVKHAHSGQNPERNWGQFVLQSIRFALWALNDHTGRNWTASDVRIVAAGVSNGGGAALLAAEQDTSGLIDGVVVSEPQVQPRRGDFRIRDRGQLVPAHSRSLFDVTTFMDVFADCASGSGSNPVTPSAAPGVARCPALKERGYLNGATLPQQIQEARSRIHSYGVLPDTDKLMASHANLHLWRILAPVYGNAYARATVPDHLCKTSFASTNAEGSPAPWDETSMRKAFGASNGLPAATTTAPGGGPVIINDAANPPRNELLEPDLNLDGALCWRSLATGRTPPTPVLPTAAQQTALKTGVSEVRATGNLRGKPAIILHGRKDALVAPNHSSRAYFALNRMVEGSRSRARYIEVANGNHFDAFIQLYPAFGSPGEQLVAMHGYFNQAVETMLRHLGNGAALPGSQAFAATEETCPVPTSPAAADRIQFSGGELIIPAGGPPAGCGP